MSALLRPFFKRLFPSPAISAMLLLSWLMINESASAGQWLLGASLAIAIPWFTERFRTGRAHHKAFSAFSTALKLSAVVLWDILKSNWDVARRVLGPEAAIQPRFVWVPLDLREPHAVVLLAGIITTTPGTISADLSDDRRALLVHALHCPDEEAAAQLVADIKARYEAPLKEIFE